MPLVMVFIDGLGLGSSDPAQNPLTMATMPCIRNILGGEPLTAKTVGEGAARKGLVVRPTDACLGVDGIPQSATGQTVIFTGVNAAQAAGRHINGFPTRALREFLKQYSLFKILNRYGFRAVFANIFTKEYFDAVSRGRWRHSVTTTAALAGDCRLFMLPDLEAGRGVFQDITNQILRERGYEAPLLQAEEAARNLAQTAAEYDFTLFEYFQTDHCGHKQDPEWAGRILNLLDRFLGALIPDLARRGLDLLVVSDHGNIEDLSVKTHTRNRVPTIAIGERAAEFQQIQSLMDIYPAVLRYFKI
ncbi:MAG: alkaline phosphatase family protein [Firmicutes bacterium]|nr:alkaline phosphatase family protein [Bacillota bacterium]